VDLTRGVETARLEVDAPVTCLAALPDGRLVAGDAIRRLHWLVIGRGIEGVVASVSASGYSNTFDNRISRPR
jgi:hypothetical protein